MKLLGPVLLSEILLCALLVHGRQLSPMPNLPNGINVGQSPMKSPESELKSNLLQRDVFSIARSDHSILVKCQCSSGCPDVGVYYTLMEDMPKGYCGDPYRGNHVKGSRCATFCNNLDDNDTCSINSVDPEELYRIKGSGYNSVWYNQGSFVQSYILTCKQQVLPFFQTTETISNITAASQGHANGTDFAQERGLSLAKVACTAYDGYCYLAKNSKCEFKCPWWKIWCTECKPNQIKEKKCSGGTSTLIRWGCRAVSWKSVMGAVKDIIWDFFW